MKFKDNSEKNRGCFKEVNAKRGSGDGNGKERGWAGFHKHRREQKEEKCNEEVK